MTNITHILYYKEGIAMKKHHARVLLVVILVGLFFTGCTEAWAAPRDLQLSFGGSSTGGVLYYMSGAFANVVTPKLVGINVTNVTTGASVDNAIRIARGELDLAYTYASLAYEASHGIGTFEPPALASIAQNIMGIARAYDSDFYFVVLKKSGIKKLSDLSGRTVSLGPPGSGTQYVADMVVDSFGIDCKREYRSFADTVEAMQDGHIDAVAQSGSPAGGVTELAETSEIEIIPFSDEEIAALKVRSPFFFADRMPAGRYRGVTQPVQVPHFRSYWIVNRDMDPDVLYKILEVTFQPEVLKELAAGHNNWNYVAEDTEGFEALGLKVHPGAKKYFADHPEAPRAGKTK
jgi:TRAP transporter TAXI family solute receptor